MYVKIHFALKIRRIFDVIQFDAASVGYSI